jgi:hypothetical protein
MKKYLSIGSPLFLGGQNVHSLIKITLVGIIVYKMTK